MLATRTLVSAACLLALVVAAPARAIEPNAPGELAISVFVAESPEFIREWVSTPSSHGPTIKRIRRIRFDQTVHAGFIVTGYTRRDDLHLDFEVDIRVVDPNGRILFEKNGWARHTGRIDKERSFVLADPVLDVLIEATDPEGRYRIEATVHDHVSTRSATGEWDLDVGP